MVCTICGGDHLIPIFDASPIAIWTGADDETNALSLFQSQRLECKLFQCQHCGHVQREVNANTEKITQAIYNSSLAQGTTRIGSGNWGKERFGKVLSHFNFKGLGKSALEIGCADGYLLKQLTTLGYTKLIGIEPSLSENSAENTVALLKRYVSADLKLNTTFDLIYSIAVFEHIEKIRDIMVFSKAHLENGGKLFFAVPNAELQLENGDPALFLHEHIHYFTKSSINHLLTSNGFSLDNLESTADTFYVRAVKKEPLVKMEMQTTRTYTNYQAKVDMIINRISDLIRTLQITGL